MAGNFIDTPGLYPIAKEVAKECGGLPVTIVTVGKALANYQSLDEVTKISSKSRVESNNTEDQSIVHRVVDSITENKWQRYISEDWWPYDL